MFIRCSNTQGVFKDNQTYIEEDNEYIKLHNPNNNDISLITNLYFLENTSDSIVDYKKMYTSMNNGDYLKPII